MNELLIVKDFIPLFDTLPSPLTVTITVPLNGWLDAGIGFLVIIEVVGIIRWFRSIFI